MEQRYKYDNDNLAFYPDKTFKVVQLILLALIFALIISSIGYFLLKKEEKTTTKYILTENIVKKPEYKKTVFELIDNYPFKFKGLIKAQAIEESGNFTSPVFKENNNCLGMRLPHQRLTLATGSNLNHATYKCLEDCIIDRLIYEAKYLNDLNKKEYLTYLDSVYAESGGYSERLLKIEKSL